MCHGSPQFSTIVDLIHGDSGSINGALFDFTTAQPIGTGVIQPFLRVQADGVEHGYNTSGAPVPFDDKVGPWTHDLIFADPRSTSVTVGNTNYFKLLLDINEPGGSRSTISLDQLQFYTSSTGSQTTKDVSSLGTLRYSFSPGDAVDIDASRNHGSGSGDMYAYVPASAFAGTSSSDFVYLYCHFGHTPPSEGRKSSTD